GRLERNPERERMLGQPARFDRAAKPGHARQVEMEVVSGQKPRGEDLPGGEEMPEVGARETRASGTSASRLERTLGFAMTRVPDRDSSARDERHSVPGVARRQDAIEEVEPHGSELYQLVGCSDPHEIARTVGGKVRKRLTGHVERTVPALADRQ